MEGFTLQNISIPYQIQQQLSQTNFHHIPKAVLKNSANSISPNQEYTLVQKQLSETSKNSTNNKEKLV